jgi:hypothetical protein
MEASMVAVRAEGDTLYKVPDRSNSRLRGGKLERRARFKKANKRTGGADR